MARKGHTVRVKVYSFSELNPKAQQKAKRRLHALCLVAHEEEFGEMVILKEGEDFPQWEREHFNTKDYEFTQEGNIFFK